MEWVELKLFISSTFRDMYFEREFLVKHVLWQLKQWCDARRILLKEIDLRWGVTEHMSQAEKSTIATCLAGIDSSRVFLCLLGQYRGWIPQPSEVSADTVERYPALGAVLGWRSATEIEVFHELSRAESPRHAAIFYRRQLLADIPGHLVEAYTNAGLPRAQREQADAAMAALYEEVLPAQGHHPVTYSAHFAGDTLTDFRVGDADLAASLLDQLTATIQALFPTRSPQPLLGLAATLDAQSRRRFLAGQDFIDSGELDAIDQEWAARTQSLILHGGPGSGKTSLYAAWLARHPVAYRFCTPADTGESILASLIEEVTGQPSQQTDFAGLLSELGRTPAHRVTPDSDPGSPGITTSQQPLTLALDGLESFPTGQLTALFDHPGLRLLGTITTGSPAADRFVAWAGQRGLATHQVTGFTDPAWRDALADHYLAGYLKRLDDSHKQLLRANPGTANPLFLAIVLRELRLFGTFEQLGEQLAGFGDTPRSAFAAVLARLEADATTLGFDPAGLGWLFAALVVSPAGLSADELSQVSALPPDRVHLLAWQIEPFLASRTADATVYTFRYGAFREAAAARYAHLIDGVHQRLWDLFESASHQDQGYVGPLRILEALFHHGRATGQAAALAGDLSWVDGCLRSGGVSQLVTNLSQVPAEGVAAQLRDFVTTHAAALARHPTSLLSWLLTESGALGQLAHQWRAHWAHPFIDITLLSGGGPDQSVNPGHPGLDPSSSHQPPGIDPPLGFALLASRPLDKALALDAAFGPGFVFRWTQPGLVQVVDTRHLHSPPMGLPIATGRVEALFVAPDARHLAVALTSGQVRVYQVNLDDRVLNWSHQVWQGDYLLPETAPAMAWTDPTTLVFQGPTGELRAAQVDADPRDAPLGSPLEGEITALASPTTYATGPTPGLVVDGHPIPITAEVTALCAGPDWVAMASIDGHVTIIQAGQVVFRTPQPIRATALAWRGPQLYVVCDADLRTGDRPVVVVDEHGRATNLAATEVLFPRTLLNTVVKAGFSPEGDFQLATNFAYTCATITAHASPPAAQLSHVVALDQGWAVIWRQGETYRLVLDGQERAQITAPAGLAWAGGRTIAVGNPRTGAHPVVVASAAGLVSQNPPEVMSVVGADGWALAESGQLWQVNPDGWRSVGHLAKPAVPLTSLAQARRWLVVGGIDADSPTPGLRLYVYRLGDAGPRLEHEFFLTGGHLQGWWLVDNELCVLWQRDSALELIRTNLYPGCGMAATHPGDWQRTPLGFLRSTAQVALCYGHLLILDTAHTLFLCDLAGTLLCSLNRRPPLIRLAQSGPVAWVASADQAWACGPGLKQLS
jgi:hypothetical protein